MLLLDDPDLQVNGVLLDRLVLEEEYVAVLFLGECEGEEKVLGTCLPRLSSSLVIHLRHFLLENDHISKRPRRPVTS